MPSFHNHFLASYFSKHAKTGPQHTWHRKNQNRLVKRSSIEVSGSSEVPWFVRELFFSAFFVLASLKLLPFALLKYCVESGFPLVLRNLRLGLESPSWETRERIRNTNN